MTGESAKKWSLRPGTISENRVKFGQGQCRVEPMFDRLGWLSVNQLVTYHTVLQVFKIRKSQEPEYLYDILGIDNRNGHIIVTNTGLSLAKKSFTFRGSELWNNLPSDIRKIQKIGTFKKACRDWVKDNIPRFLT